MTHELDVLHHEYVSLRVWSRGGRLVKDESLEISHWHLVITNILLWNIVEYYEPFQAQLLLHQITNGHSPPCEMPKAGASLTDMVMRTHRHFCLHKPSERSTFP